MCTCRKIKKPPPIIMTSPSPILILGNRGFIGSVVFQTLHARYGEHVRGFSSKDLDLTVEQSSEELARQSSHETALVVVSGIRDHSLDALKKNVAMMVHVGEVIEKQPISHCIYLSSMSVYGSDPKDEIITEKIHLNLDSLYALGKYAGEAVLQKACANTKTPFLILRLPRVYGHGDTHANYGPAAFVAGIAARGEMVLYGDGEELREFLYVEDLANIVDLSIRAKTTGVINVVSGVSHSFAKAAEILKHIVQKPFAIHHLPRTGWRFDEHYDNTQFQTAFSDYSFTPLEEGLRRSCQEAGLEVK